MTETTDLVKVNEEIKLQISNPEIQNALIQTTFKNFPVDLMKQAILEGMMRGYKFEDFLKKNVYAIKYGDGYSLVMSVDNARKIGAKSGVMGILLPTYEMEKDGINIKSCSMTVQKLVSGHVGNFSSQVFFKEFYKAGYNGKPSLWDKMPRVMIAKVAEMHALRKACPEELSQAYLEEEIIKVNTAPTETVDFVAHKKNLESAESREDFLRIWSAMPVLAKEELKKDGEYMSALKARFEEKAEPKKPIAKATKIAPKKAKQPKAEVVAKTEEKVPEANTKPQILSEEEEANIN